MCWLRFIRNRARSPGHAPADTPLATDRIGRWGEALAEQRLRALGWRFLGRRVRAGRRGEIDLLFREGNTLIFVEVKTRASERFGRPSAALDRAKRRQISRAAIAFVRRLRRKPKYLRFDVVEVIGRPDDPAPPIIRHIENAFPLEGRYFIPW
jgi:putative endonuclease